MNRASQKFRRAGFVIRKDVWILVSLLEGSMFAAW